VVVDLLQVKWKSFVKREFFIKMFLYIIFFCFASVAFIARPLRPTDCEPAMSDLNATAHNATDIFTTEIAATAATLEDTTATVPYDANYGRGNTSFAKGKGTPRVCPHKNPSIKYSK
jgi:hypothetical protein